MCMDLLLTKTIRHLESSVYSVIEQNNIPKPIDTRVTQYRFKTKLCVIYVMKYIIYIHLV